MKKIKEYKGIIIIVLILILGAFYWFELRPVLIKRQCLWFTQLEAGKPAIPAFTGITKEEAEKSNIKKREEINEACKKTGNKICPFFYSISEKPTRPAQPAEPDKIVTKEATKKQYNGCLKHHGI